MSDPCWGLPVSAGSPLFVPQKLDIRISSVYTMYIHSRRTFTYDCKTSKMGK